MPDLAISRKVKVAGKGWRYQRVLERPGVKTGSLTGPFFIRVTLNKTGAGGRNKQNWVPLDAETFDEAKIERDRKLKGQALAAENNAGRVALADAVASFLELKERSTK